MEISVPLARISGLRVSGLRMMGFADVFFIPQRKERSSTRLALWTLISAYYLQHCDLFFWDVFFEDIALPLDGSWPKIDQVTHSFFSDMHIV